MTAPSIPGLASWDILSRPFGTQFVSGVLTQALKRVIFSIACGTTKVVPRCRTLELRLAENLACFAGFVGANRS
jgi:hypothetical protein